MILQIRLLIHYNQLIEKEGIEEYASTVGAIATSLMMASIHCALELVYIGVQAQGNRTSFINYAIVCFNGRFGFVPYVEDMVTAANKTATPKMSFPFLKK